MSTSSLRGHHSRTAPAVGFTPFETRADVIVAVAQQADRLGFSGVSVAEAMSLSAPVVLTEIALTTERVEVASGVLSVWSRSPATLALTAAELQRLSSGRFLLGLGASTSPLTEGLHGIPWQRPLGKTRDVLVAVRALLAGERLPAPPEGARPLRLVQPPEVPVPLGLAAITAPSVRLAGALADRWLPFLWPSDRLAEGRELLAHGARTADRVGVPQLMAAVPVAVGPDEASAAAIAARWLVTYCTAMGPVYPRILRAFGYSAEIDALLEANSDPRRPVLPLAAERLARDVLLFADQANVGAALDDWHSVSDAVSLTLPFGLDPDALTAMVDALALRNSAGTSVRSAPSPA